MMPKFDPAKLLTGMDTASLKEMVQKEKEFKEKEREIWDLIIKFFGEFDEKLDRIEKKLGELNGTKREN